MTKNKYPTTTQANITYFIMAVLTLTGSVIFMPLLGIGTNLWINEFVYILFPALLLAGINRWKPEDTYRYKGTKPKNAIFSILLGICSWFFVSLLTKLIDMLLNSSIGKMEAEAFNDISLSQSLLLLIGMVILAPICEETLFRGFIQKAYERQNSKYGFVVSAFLFGLFHILNGVKDVIPAFILGLVFGFIAYRTGSITGSMLAHAANNICSIAFGGFLAVGIPSWFIAASIVALIAIILLLKGLNRDCYNDEIPEEEPLKQKLSVPAVMFLILSMAFMIFMGAMEILARAGIIFK